MELDPGRRVVDRTTARSTVDARTEIVCEESPDATRVAMHVEARPKGALRLIPREALEAVSLDELRATLARPKERLEAAGRP